MSAHTLLVVFVAIVMVIGVVGTVLPILPGLWLIWAAAVVYGLLAGFGSVGWTAISVITVLAIVGTVAVVYLPQREASAIGIPWWGQLLALAAAIVGFFLIPIVGAPLGFAVGILVVATFREPGLADALAATKSTLKAMLLASGVQLTIGVVMTAAWVAWVSAG
ncbi:MAG: DUF456 domain-containing protein [Actinomycetota bacterium]